MTILRSHDIAELIDFVPQADGSYVIFPKEQSATLVSAEKPRVCPHGRVWLIGPQTCLCDVRPFPTSGVKDG